MSMTLFTGARFTDGFLDPEPAGPARAKISPLAVAAAVCAVLGFLTTGGFLAGVVLGHLALVRIKRSNGRLRGRRLAWTALVVSWIPIVITTVVFVAMFLIGLDATVHNR
ncbi:DUF4190 domain-containing protein [Micrococcaceae bacterium Sec7.4]